MVIEILMDKQKMLLLYMIGWDIALFMSTLFKIWQIHKNGLSENDQFKN